MSTESLTKSVELATALHQANNPTSTAVGAEDLIATATAFHNYHGENEVNQKGVELAISMCKPLNPNAAQPDIETLLDMAGSISTYIAD